LDGKRHPGAQADMHETKVPVQIVKIQCQTARRTLLQVRATFAVCT
jgi:hypothetical protein